MSTGNGAVGFKKATKQHSRLRLALCGPAGSGKTKSALRVAKGYGGRIAVIDTERGSASLYADEFEFDVLEIEPPYLPSKYVAAIRAAAGYDILIIDSLSHAWAGEGGILESVDAAQARPNANKFTVWGPATKAQNELVNTILGCPQFVIAAMRSKQEYSLQTDSRGKQVPVKLGMAPVQRDGMEYEFGVVLDIGMDHTAGVGMAGKDRTGLFTADSHILTEDDGKRIREWINSAPPPAVPPPERTGIKYADPSRNQIPAGTVQAEQCETILSLCQELRFTKEQFWAATKRVTGTPTAPALKSLSTEQGRGLALYLNRSLADVLLTELGMNLDDARVAGVQVAADQAVELTEEELAPVLTWLRAKVQEVDEVPA